MPSGATNQETPSQGEPFVIHSFGNVGPPLMATLILSRLTIGLPIWLLSSMVIPSALIISYPSSPSQEHQHHVDLSPSSPYVYYSFSPSFPVESCDASNQVDKKKKKRKIKKNINKKPNIDQLLLTMIRVFIFPQKHLISLSSLANFARVTIFLRIFMVFPKF